jgi:tyrosine-protein kinase Etk/Wzc
MSSAVKSAISVQHLRDTRIVLLRARDSSPERAKALANAVAQAYIDFAEEQGSQARSRSVAWLSDEIEGLRDTLRTSEERLVDYLAAENIETSEMEAWSGAASGGVDEAMRTQLSTAELELSQLLGRYRTRHPKVEEARERVGHLRGAIVRDQAARTEESRKLIQYRLVKRDAELDQEMYAVLLKKLKEADVSGGIAESNIRVLERAKEPRVPIAPRTIRNMGVAVVIAICLALGLAIAVEYFDRSLGSAEEVSRAVGLPTLGVVSVFSRGRREDGLAIDAPGGSVGEMFRTLRTNLRFSHVDLPRRVVLVTSTGPQEGKSTIVANLGASLAQSGRRTLVVDTDLRKPSLHRVLATPKNDGVADVLAGDISLSQAVRATRVQGLDVLVAGTVPANPAELIESARLQALISELRESYEYVLLDSPPAAGLVDASLLSAVADGVLFVVESRRFDLRVLRAALRQLDRAGAKLYGVVLNKAPRRDGVELYGYYAEEPDVGVAAPETA